MSVKKELDKFGKYLVTQSRANLTRQGKKNTGELYKSLSYEVKVSKNSFEFSFFGADYMDFVDKGVKGVKSSTKAPRSPYKFGSGTGKKGGLTNGVTKWVQKKRIQFKNEKGQFMSYERTAYIIRRSIWFTGLEETKFYSRPFELGFKKLPDELVEAYALEVENLLNFSRQ